jgi:hypothetical protein
MKLTLLMTLAMLAASTTTTTAAQQHARSVHARSTADSSRVERQKASNVKSFRGIAAKLNTTPEALQYAFESARAANPKLSRGNFVAANVLANNLGARHPNITTQAILSGLQSGKSVGQTLQSLGLSASEAKQARRAADHDTEAANKLVRDTDKRARQDRREASRGTTFSAGSVKPAGPSLGRATSFVVLGGSTVTNTGATAITGDLGVSSPGVSVTGFPPGTMARGAQHVGDPAANQAQADAQSAYAVLAGKPCTTPLTGQDLGGKSLAPGVYCFTSSAQLTGRLVLDGRGKGDNAVWIFQIASTLTTATNSSVVMSKGGRAGNVFWQVGSGATLGTGTAFAGNILAYSSITMNTASNLSGRALAREAVTMDNNSIRAPK